MAVLSKEIGFGGARSTSGNVTGCATLGRGVVGSGNLRLRGGHSASAQKDCFRVATLNVGTLRGRVCEVAETLSRRRVDVCCLQETRYRNKGCRTITGREEKMKLFWSGNGEGTAGVGIMIAEEWVDKVFDVQRKRESLVEI